MTSEAGAAITLALSRCSGETYVQYSKIQYIQYSHVSVFQSDVIDYCTEG